MATRCMDAPGELMHRIPWKQRGAALGGLDRASAYRRVQRHRERMKAFMRATGLDWHNARQQLRSLYETNERLVTAFGSDVAKQMILRE